MVARGTDGGFAKIARSGISSVSRTTGCASIDSATFRRAVVLGAGQTDSRRGKWFENRRNDRRLGPARLSAGANCPRTADGFERHGKREVKEQLAVSHQPSPSPAPVRSLIANG